MSKCVVGEKKEVFFGTRKRTWKGLSGTYIPESIRFFVAMYSERCVQWDLHKGTSQIRLENMYPVIRHKSSIINSVIVRVYY